MTAQTLTQSRLKELLHYDPDTGIFTNRTTRGSAKAGAVSGSMSIGYILISVEGVRHGAHRLAWLYVHGEFPPVHMDHINHVRDDNRISNLRLVTHAENARNRRLSSNNKSGALGVCWNNSEQAWQTQINIDGRRISLGFFKSFNLANRVRKEAEAKHGYHPNHGGGRGNVAKEKPKTPEMIARLESYK